MKTLVFGDSHARSFYLSSQMLTLRPDLRAFDISMHMVVGATIRGLGKWRSTLNTSDLIRTTIAEDRPGAVILCFGQVDLELGLYYSRIVRNEALDPEAFIQDVLRIYREYLAGHLQSGYRLVVKGVNPPTLLYCRETAVEYTDRVITENVFDEKTIALLREKLRRIYPSDDERQGYHALFNARLEALCGEIGADYFDLYDYMTEGGQSVRPDLISATPDHHVVDTLGVRIAHLDRVLEILKN